MEENTRLKIFCDTCSRTVSFPNLQSLATRNKMEPPKSSAIYSGIERRHFLSSLVYHGATGPKWSEQQTTSDSGLPIHDSGQPHSDLGMGGTLTGSTFAPLVLHAGRWKDYAQNKRTMLWSAGFWAMREIISIACSQPPDE